MLLRFLPHWLRWNLPFSKKKSRKTSQEPAQSRVLLLWFSLQWRDSGSCFLVLNAFWVHVLVYRCNASDLLWRNWKILAHWIKTLFWVLSGCQDTSSWRIAQNWYHFLAHCILLLYLIHFRAFQSPNPFASFFSFGFRSLSCCTISERLWEPLDRILLASSSCHRLLLLKEESIAGYQTRVSDADVFTFVPNRPGLNIAALSLFSTL